MAGLQDILAMVPQRRQPRQQDNSLGQMLAFLSKSADIPPATLPQVQMPSNEIPSFVQQGIMRSNEQAIRDKQSQKVASFADQLFGTKANAPGDNVGPVLPGTGMLGDNTLSELDRKLLEQSKAMLQTGNPVLVESALNDLGKLRSDLADTEKATALEKLKWKLKPDTTVSFEDYMSMPPDLQSAFKGYRQAMNPGTSISLGMGQEYRPGTPEENARWGFAPDARTKYNAKTGELEAVKTSSMTEEQGKATMYLAGTEKALSDLREQLPKIQLGVPGTRQATQDYIGSVLEATNMPVVKDAGRAMQSADQQKFNQAVSAIRINLTHALTGAGQNEAEAVDKANTLTPQWGDDEATIKQKMDTITNEIEALKLRAGQVRPGARDWSHLTAPASEKYGIPKAALDELIKFESGGNPNAQSPTGPQGLTQLGAAAASDNGLNPAMRFDPASNVETGAAYLKQQIDEFGPDLAYAAYHDGPQAVRNFLAGKGTLSSEAIRGANKIGPLLKQTSPLDSMDDAHKELYLKSLPPGTEVTIGGKKFRTRGG